MAGVQRLSAPEIFKLSRDVFNKLSSQHQIELSAVHEVLNSARFDLSDSEIKDVELAVLLIASAHEASNNHFDNTRKLLNLCGFLSSNKGNTVQRVVHYFTKALQQRIARETRIIPSKSEGKKVFCPNEHIETAIDPDYVSCWLQIPFYQVSQFVAMQEVINSLSTAKRVHFIALSIRNGIYCPVLMQALANRHEHPVEFLKITAIGMSESKQKIEEIGRSLTSLAETLNLPFSFCSARIDDIKDLGKEIFETSKDEEVAMFSMYRLRYIRAMPDCWKSFPRFIMNFHPCVMVVVETEENFDSPLLIERFHEALVPFSSLYDCIEAFLSKEDRSRVLLEETVGQELEQILAAKDEERVCRFTNVARWRAFFAGLGMVETEVSFSSFDQANLLLRNSAYEESCLLKRNGKCLVTGWKGTPFVSVSTWKFESGKSKSRLAGKKFA